MSIARTDPGYGAGQHTINEHELPPTRAEISALVLAAFNAPDYQPPVLPSTALELVQISRRPDITFPEISRFIEREPLIATQLLRIAQSPVYRRAAPIRSLEQAASLLGMRSLGDLFLQAALTAKVFRAPGYEKPMNQLRDHCVATAIIARQVCRETSLGDEYAFLCGLLHDIGIAACIIALAEEARRPKGSTRAFNWEDVWPVVCEMHEDASLKLGQLWKLPPDVCLVIGHHHQLTVGGLIHPLAAVVCVADGIAADLDRGMEVESDPRDVARAVEALCLTPAQIDKVRRECQPLVESV
jgi:putative nucleotidyltransferase with HDIG domain